MNYSKNELTEYNGERGYWRTINGRKIFISIEDTKEEREKKIKNFVERKRSNTQDAIQRNIDEANREFDRQHNLAREKYRKLRDKLNDKNLSQEEKDKIKREMDGLVMAHGKKDKEELERKFTKKEVKVASVKKKVLEEKTNKPEESVEKRRTMTDPYIKFGEKIEKEHGFASKLDEERYYSNLRKEVINYFIKKGRKYNDNDLINNAEQLADKYIKERRNR